jgi:hypothetical protein
MNTIAALVRLPNHDRKPNEVSQGPMESALHGIGLWLLMAIFITSDRASIQLLTRKEQPVSGQITENSDRYPGFD